MATKKKTALAAALETADSTATDVIGELTEPTAGAEDTALTDLIDRYGALSSELASITADLGTQIDSLREQIEARVIPTLEGPDDTAKVRAAKYILSIGAQAKARKLVDLRKAAELLGKDIFLKVATVPLKALDDYLNPEQRALVLEETRSERRTFAVKALVS